MVENRCTLNANPQSRVINFKWANMKKFLFSVLVSLCVPMLVSCGGEVEDEPGTVRVTVNAGAGMTGLMLKVLSPDLLLGEDLYIPSAGRYRFRTAFPPSTSSFDVYVWTQPVNGKCALVEEEKILFFKRVSYDLTVNCRINQTISWAQDDTPNGGTVSLTATASSGLAVLFVDRTAAPEVSACSLVGNQLTYLSSGASCTIAATQVGSDNYFPAPEISKKFINPI